MGPMQAEPSKMAVIATALEIETRAVLRRVADQWIEEVLGTSVFRGTFQGWDVAVVETGPGNAAAASISTRVCDHYRPDLALFVGVAGGVKDVKLGDVVVARRCTDTSPVRTQRRVSGDAATS